MNDASPSTSPDTRMWWRTLIVTMLVGPFVPFLCTGMKLGGSPNYGGLMIGTALWFLTFIGISFVTGWQANARRGTAARLCLTLLFVLAACVVGLGLGFAECSAAK